MKKQVPINSCAGCAIEKTSAVFKLSTWDAQVAMDQVAQELNKLLDNSEQAGLILTKMAYSREEV